MRITEMGDFSKGGYQLNLGTTYLVFRRFFQDTEIFSSLNTSLCLSYSVYKIKTIQTHKDAEGTNEIPKTRKKCGHGYMYVIINIIMYICTYIHIYIVINTYN